MEKFAFIGSDYPDYWSGYHLPVVLVPVYGVMTCAEVADEIESELNQIFDLFDEIWNDEHEKMYEDFLSELRQKSDTIFIDPEYITDPEEWDDGADPLNLYFSFCNPVNFGGINFLNP